MNRETKLYDITIFLFKEITSKNKTKWEYKLFVNLIFHESTFMQTHQISKQNQSHIVPLLSSLLAKCQYKQVTFVCLWSFARISQTKFGS